MLCRAMETSAMDSWSLTLLGGFELRPTNGALIDLPGQKDRALLALLAMGSGDVHSRERLAGLLWSEHGDRQARDSLKQALVRLRRCVGGVEGGVLRTDRQSIALDRTAFDVDVLAFERLVAAGTLDSLAQATEIYRGDLLEGIVIRDPAFENWLLVERQRLGQLFERALAGLMAQALAAGHGERGAEAARRLLQVDPLSEAAYRTLMQVHADEGQTSRAIKLYKALRDRLHREMGIQPEPETKALCERIRARQTAAAASAEPVPTPESPPPDRDDSPAAAKSSIAVLPFLNLGGDPEQRYYSDGISEDIATGLSRFRSLLVIARNSAFQYRDQAVDVRTVAHDLGVHYVVEGSVRKADDRIRVTVQLIDATTGNHLWAQQYDHELSNLFTVQDEVTQTIVATLEGRIAAGAAARARRKPTQHMDAYDYVLQARDLMARYDLAAAEPLLARAIAADPTYAEAFARHAYVSLSRYWADQDGVALNEAAMLAQKALALDADDDWSNFAMGTVRLSMRQFDQAGSHYERILTANPNNVTCATIFAELLTYVGRPVEALRQLDETMRRDPFPPNWYWEIRGMALFCLERYDEAIAAYSKMTILHPWIQAYLVAAYVHAGRRDDADHQLALYRGEHPGGSLLEIAKQEPYKDDRFRDLLIAGLQAVVPAFEGMDGDASRERPATVPLVIASPAGGESSLDPAARRLSIAVLPFTNMSGDPDQEYFADGLTEDIITDLSQVSALSVVARHTAFAFKGKTLQVQQVTRDLKVDYVLEGSVRKSDGQVRVTAQLIDAATGDHRWAHRYDRRFDDIFALQDEISKSIVDVLRVTLLPAELETITRHPTADARAYEYYLMGRFFYLRGQSKRHLAIARDMYAKAAEIDPDYARAYAGMAICDSSAAASHPDGSFETALANSERALALDANLAEAYAAKGFALFAAVRFDEAAVEFERATRLDAGLFEAHFFHARNCHNQGLRAEAAALFARAAELRPSDFRSPGLLAWECKALGRREQCAAALRRCLARLEAEVKAHPDNADALVFGSSILVESGDSARAEDWLARAIILGPDDRFVQYNAALTNAMLGRRDTALDHLEQAFSAPPTFRRRLAAWMKYDDEMDGLRDHARFQALLAGLDADGATAAARPAPESAGPAAERDAPPATKPSIAVLPFTNMSGDPEQQYFSDGITDDIITELSRFRTLFVIARNSSFQYRGGALDMVRIGRELGVRYLCEGSVRRIGERVRIGVQLIEAASGRHLWGENFDRDAADILTVQDDIVRAIATTLGYRVEAAGRERALRLIPEALSAYDLMLRSEALMLRHSKADNAEAQRLAKQAVEIDPKSALAHAQLGWTYCLDRIFGWVEESGETLGTALALAQRAVLLDETDCRARWLLGHVHVFRREYDEARAHLHTALALNPNDVEARGVYGIYLYAVGESDAALEQFDIARRHNPFEFNWIIMCRGIALFTARRYDEAVATLKQVHNPTNEVRLWLAASYAGAGCLPEARAALAEFLAVAERDMAQFPGRKLADWRPHLHRFVEYRDLREFDHLAAALQASGLE
jgi:adenylate cyclase